MRVLTSDEVRQIAMEAASRTDTPASLLVQRAGYAVAQFCLAHFKFRSVCVVCGAGGDGDYGLMAAQVLSGIAEQVSAIVLAKDASALSSEAAAICDSLATEPMWVSDEAGFQDEASPASAGSRADHRRGCGDGIQGSAGRDRQESGGGDQSGIGNCCLGRRAFGS